MKAQALTTRKDHQLAAYLLAVLLSLAMILPARSQVSDKQLALVESENILGLKEANSENAFYEAVETDNPNNVEAWMSSDNYWGTVDYRFEADNELEVELWMYCDYYWTGKPCKALLEPTPVNEQPLKIENWMSDDHYWSGK